jgi:hypothetical protein
MTPRRLAAALGPTAALAVLAALALLAPPASSTYVAVGESGTILTSATGTSWSAETSPTSNTLHAVAQGDGKLVAVGAGGTILTSPDGDTWTQQCPAGSGTGCPPSTTVLRAVAYNGTRWMAVGHGMTILTSTDASAWTAQSAGTLAGDLYAVAARPGQWLASGHESPNKGQLAFSADGASWTQLTWASQSNFEVNGLAYGGAQWSWVGKVLSSGETILAWEDSPAANPWSGSFWKPAGSASCHAVHHAAAQARFVAACENAIHRASAPITGAASWSSANVGNGRALTYDSQWIVVGLDGMAATSADGGTWTTQSTGTSSDLLGVAPVPNHPPQNRFNGATFSGGLSGNQGQSTSRDTARVFSAANSNRLTVTDPDATSSDVLRFSWSAAQGTLTLAGTTGLSFTCAADTPVPGPPACAGDGTADPAMTFRGTVSDLNAALDGARFDPPAAFCGSQTILLTLTVYDEGRTGYGGNLWDRDTVTVSVPCPPPACSASAANSVTAADLTFTASDGVPPYTWSSPGSNDPSGTGATHVRRYATSGPKTVTVTDSATPALSGTCSITVYDALSCTPASQSVAVGQNAAVSAAGGRASHSWTATGSGNAGPVAGASWTGAFTTAGTYTVTAADSDPAQSVSCQVTVAPVLACAAFPATIEWGDATTFTASGPPGPFTWTFPLGAPASATGASASVAYTQQGLRTATVASTAPAQTATCTVQVRPPLVCMATRPAVHVGEAAIFRAQDGSGAYQWTAAGNAIWTGAPAPWDGLEFVPVWGTPGLQTVTLRDAGPPAKVATCRVDVLPPGATYPSDAEAFQPGPGSAPPVALARFEGLACTGRALAFSGGTSFDVDGHVVAHSWRFGDGADSSGMFATHAYAVPGTYTLTLEVRDDSGMTGRTETVLQVSACGGLTAPPVGTAAPPLPVQPCTTCRPPQEAVPVAPPALPVAEPLPDVPLETREDPDPRSTGVREAAGDEGAKAGSQGMAADAEVPWIPILVTAGVVLAAFGAGLALDRVRRRRPAAA